MKKLIFISAILFITSSLFAATVDTATIFSNAMHKKIKCVIIKPNAYKEKNIRFPVLYLLHGLTDSYAYWVTDIPGIKNEVDKYNMIIVCPDGGFDSWYFDSPLDTTRKYETHISKEVIQYVDANYRTINDREHRAIAGLSMGGHGAFYIGLRHTDLFGAVGSTSGVLDIYPLRKYFKIDNLIGDTLNYKNNWQQMSVMNMIDHYPVNKLAIIIDCGTEDPLYAINKQFHEKLLQLHVLHDYTERPGEHVNEYWKNAIQYQLLFFANYFNKMKD